MLKNKELLFFMLKKYQSIFQILFIHNSQWSATLLYPSLPGVSCLVHRPKLVNSLNLLIWFIQLKWFGSLLIKWTLSFHIYSLRSIKQWNIWMRLMCCTFFSVHLQSTVQLGLDFLWPESLQEATRLAEDIRGLPNNHNVKQHILEVSLTVTLILVSFQKRPPLIPCPLFQTHTHVCVCVSPLCHVKDLVLV